MSKNKEKDIVILYHQNCSDGFAAAYAAWKKFGDEAEYIPVTYQTEPPDVTGKEVYIVDFSYPRDVLEEMNSTASFLLVLDHHKTAQAALFGLEYAIFDMNRSGAMMSFNYFHPDVEPPILIQHVQDRDLWKFELFGTKYYMENLNSYPMDFETWDLLVTQHNDLEEYNAFIQSGQAIRRSFENQCQKIIDSGKYSVIINGIQGLGCNAPAYYSSDAGNLLSSESGTFGFTWYVNSKGAVNCSLRSKGEFDVSALAKLFGGGGHKNAAGFKLNSVFDVEELRAKALREVEAA